MTDSVSSNFKKPEVKEQKKGLGTLTFYTLFYQQTNNTCLCYKLHPKIAWLIVLGE